MKRFFSPPASSSENSSFIKTVQEIKKYIFQNEYWYVELKNNDHLVAVKGTTNNVDFFHFSSFLEATQKINSLKATHGDGTISFSHRIHTCDAYRKFSALFVEDSRFVKGIIKTNEYWLLEYPPLLVFLYNIDNKPIKMNFYKPMDPDYKKKFLFKWNQSGYKDGYLKWLSHPHKDLNKLICFHQIVDYELDIKKLFSKQLLLLAFTRKQPHLWILLVKHEKLKETLFYKSISDAQKKISELKTKNYLSIT